MVRVFAMKVTRQDFGEDRWKPYLSRARRKEAEKRRDRIDRQCCLGAEVLLNRSIELLGEAKGLPVHYERNIHGKPYLLSPNEKIYANWSHSGEYVLCAVGDREVGVDLQWNQKEPGEKLIRRLLQEGELEFYNRQVPERKRTLFYEYWTIKESYLKALGTGFHTPLEDFYVSFESGDLQIIQTLSEEKQPGRYSCCLLDFADGNYTAALCCKGTDNLEQIEIEYLS